MSYWKNATSLIIAARNGMKCNKLGTNNYDYKILALKRNKKSNFMPGTYVFPGGMTEPADADLKWKNVYSSFGFNEESYQTLFPKANSRPTIFNGTVNELPREISLRITTIRETFEECGILLCKTKLEESKVHWTQSLSLTENDVKSWQIKVQADAGNFYKMCETFKCYPDLWSLFEWNGWLTPTAHNKKRFETVFFLAGIEYVPKTNYCTEESEDLRWETPLNLLNSYAALLPPPQCYELGRIIQYDNLNKLIDFAKERSKCGINLHFPVITHLKDGFVFLLPGDSEYPVQPSKIEQQILDNSMITILEFRGLSQSLNRIEMYRGQSEKIIVSNYKSNDGHFIPKSINKHSKETSDLKSFL